MKSWWTCSDTLWSCYEKRVTREKDDEQHVHESNDNDEEIPHGMT